MAYSKNIEKLDLTSTILRLKQDENLSVAEINSAVAEYKAYLELRLTHGVDATIHPTQAADLVWHYHILDTRKYMADCDMVFGTYLHHNPNPELPTGMLLKQRPAEFGASAVCI